eukprot:5876750-Alexandrium_andersonii.AAC.1
MASKLALVPTSKVLKKPSAKIVASIVPGMDLEVLGVFISFELRAVTSEVTVVVVSSSFEQLRPVSSSFEQIQAVAIPIWWFEQFRAVAIPM